MWGPGPHPPRAAYSHGRPVSPSRLDSSLEFTFPLSVIMFVCRLRPLSRALPKSMCVIRGRLTDRPVGVPRVVIGRATRAGTYIRLLLSSAPSAFTSSSRLRLVSVSSPTRLRLLSSLLALVGRFPGPFVVPPSGRGSPCARPLGPRPRLLVRSSPVWPHPRDVAPPGPSPSAVGRHSGGLVPASLLFYFFLLVSAYYRPLLAHVPLLCSCT